MSKLFARFYEWSRLYRLNPCDVDALPAMALVGRVLAAFGSHCKCCSGTRVLVAMAIGAAWPSVAVLLLTLGVGVVAVVVIMRGAPAEERGE
jgi:hypothetical protein